MLLIATPLPFCEPAIKSCIRHVLELPSYLASIFKVRCYTPRRTFRSKLRSPAIPNSPDPASRPGVQPASSNDSMGSEAGVIDHAAPLGQAHGSIPLHSLEALPTRLPAAGRATGKALKVLGVGDLSPAEAMEAHRQWSRSCNSVDTRDSIGTTRARLEGCQVRNMEELEEWE